MSMVSSQQDDEVMAEINITPFTDVLLVLAHHLHDSRRARHAARLPKEPAR